MQAWDVLKKLCNEQEIMSLQQWVKMIILITLEIPPQINSNKHESSDILLRSRKQTNRRQMEKITKQDSPDVEEVQIFSLFLS